MGDDKSLTNSVSSLSEDPDEKNKKVLSGNPLNNNILDVESKEVQLVDYLRKSEDAGNNDPNPGSSASGSQEEPKEPKVSYTRYQKWVLVCISCVCFMSYLLMAILAPFFPSEAARKGMSTTLSGLTFSVYALVIMVSSPVFGKLVPIVKPKPMLLVGILVSGSSNIIFGLLDRVNDSTWFITSSLIIRSLEGLGAAAFSTASFTYIMHTFPMDVSAAFGLTETFIGIGETIGPAVGGGLYALGGKKIHVDTHSSSLSLSPSKFSTK